MYVMIVVYWPGGTAASAPPAYETLVSPLPARREFPIGPAVSEATVIGFVEVGQAYLHRFPDEPEL